MTSYLDIPADARSSTGAAPSSSQQAAGSRDREINTSIPIPPWEKLYRGITSPIRLLPDFLIIGTQRGGTTSLFHYLEAHPSIAAAVNKDLHFFDRKYHKGLWWYRGHFPTRIERSRTAARHGCALLTGEASPSYLFHPYAPVRVKQALPEVRLIVLLRNPVSRAYSQYCHAVELGHETLSFEEAIRDEEERTAAEREKMLADEHYYSEAFKHRSYLSKGIYAEQLQAWMGLFAAGQFLILKSEDFYADPASSFKRVLSFLGLPHIELEAQERVFKQYNNNVYSASMDPQLRRRLSEYFEPHNARLYELLGVDFGWDA
jgi:hypothetical protein